MFFKRRGGVELVSIIILAVILGAATISIAVGLSKNAKNTVKGGLSANNSHLSAFYQSLEDELDYNPGESGVPPGSPINIDHAHTGAEGDGPRINYFDLLNIPLKFTPESHDHNSLYYAKSEIDTKLNNKANASHDHNDLYYSKNEVDAQLDDKASVNHNHDSSYYKKGETYNRSEIDSKISAVEGGSDEGKRTARFVIGTTQSGWTAGDVDYLCTGTNDQIQINDALNSLPENGGEIVILDGTYNIEGAIHVAKDNTTLRGNGNATVLKRGYNSDSTNTGATARGLITLDGKKGCKITSLYIDGNKNDYDSGNNYGIYMTSSSDNTITGNTCNNNRHGIYLYSSNNNNTITGNTCNNNYSGISLYSSSSNTITGNTCDNNTYGIYSYASSSNTIIGNTCNNNNNYGIFLGSSSSNTITGNACNNNDGHGIYLSSSSSDNTVTSNTCSSNNSYGIYLNSSSDNTVTGNTCNNNRDGIYLGSSSDNTVTSNTCSSNNSYGIYLNSSSDNTVTGNTCNNNNNGGIYLGSSSNNTVTGNTFNNNNNYGIRLYASDNNTVTGNTCNNNRDGIYLGSSNNDYNCIVGNVLVDNNTAYSSTGGTGNVEANNVKKNK